jgi:hypothetical protein
VNEWDMIDAMFAAMDRAIEEQEVSRETYTLVDFASGRTDSLWIEGT